MAGLIDLGLGMRRQALASMGDVAGQEAQRIGFNRQASAARKAAIGQTVGNAVGLGLAAHQTGLLGEAATALHGGPATAVSFTPVAGEAAAAAPAAAATAPAAAAAAPTASTATAPGAVGAAGTAGAASAIPEAMYAIGNAAGAAWTALAALFL